MQSTVAAGVSMGTEFPVTHRGKQVSRGRWSKKGQKMKNENQNKL